MPKVTYTYWRHYSKYSEEVDSMVDALRQAETAEDYGSASVESITTANGKVLDTNAINVYQKRHKELARSGQHREHMRFVALRSAADRPITWKEASTLVRHLRWKPSISCERGISFVVADMWGKKRRIVSTASLRTMTPAQFWQRLRRLDPYRVAEVERNIF